MCEEWATSFETFIRDVGLRPSPAHSIDRTDNDGHYDPGNVRWATKREQQNNMRSNRRLTYAGETHTLSEWARILGLNRATLESRRRKGLSADQILGAPVAAFSDRRDAAGRFGRHPTTQLPKN